MNSICKTSCDDKYWVIPNTEKDKLSFYDFGVLHREDGPAVEENNGPNNILKEWYINGLRHREDGPAQEWNNGCITWCLNDKIIDPTNEMMEKYIRLNPDNILKDYPYPFEIQKLAISLKPDVIFNIKYPNPKLKQLYPKQMILKNSGLI